MKYIDSPDIDESGAMSWDPLTAEQRELRDLVRTVARERVAPRAAEIDATHEFPWDVVEAFREAGLFGLFFSEEDGGTGTGTLLSLVAIEEVSRVCATSGLILAVQELGSLGLKLAGSPEQRAAWLPRLASGEVLAAYALTESESGSDSAAMRTTARRDGDAGCSTGRSGSSPTPASPVSTRCSRRPIRTPGTPGSRPSSSRPTRRASRWRGSRRSSGSAARRPGSSCSTAAACPRTRCSGRRARGSGSRCGSSTARGPGVAAQALGIAQGATDYALEYARTRETMGKPIAQHQLIAGKLADMETATEAARGLLYRYGRMVDEGAPDEELTKASAMAKLYCGDVAMQVAIDAVQILGGYGYVKEYPVERFMRDAKITQIYEGTQEIQRVVIAREMLKEARTFLLEGVA